MVLSLQTNFLYNSHSEKVILIDEGIKCACGSIPTIEKVGKKRHGHVHKLSGSGSVFENPDPVDPDPHQNRVDPHH